MTLDDIRRDIAAVEEDAATPIHPMAGPHDREIRLARALQAVLDVVDSRMGTSEWHRLMNDIARRLEKP